MGEMELIFI
ncbi:hypothetical protein AGR4A_Cc180015 [Agrobacterium tumefaciens str. B6]|uniref:Uncharacterized protein n=1 Tax=Agrobacterium tumefaciens str. B6 TaxID=1183423 RepID=A0A822UYU8_AGRTU|nr:hypothetical protein AGR4A_Cc180015 [Agrobacterium tumefaciens str. B6]